VETIASDEAVDDVVGAIIRISRHMRGDGYVTATPLEQCYRIRSGVREL
jgi:nitrogen regulatory protein PII